MICGFCGTVLPAGALLCVECGRSPKLVEFVLDAHSRRAPGVTEAPGGIDEPAAPEAADGSAAPEPPAVPAAPAEPAEAAPGAPASPAVPASLVEAAEPAVVAHGDEWEDYDAAAAPAPPPPQVDAVTFTLQFSTSESVVVTGAGLIGRNPSAEPGEFVDHLVAVFDVGKSVSKSHVEFGQEDGRLWVSDRYSTNGTLVRRPGHDPIRCEPGRRYFVERGTRVDMGDQFFVVS